jgi:NADH:ubiquinone oxidoreductase subunit 2 (subunit N)
MALFAFFLAAALGGGGVVALRERPKAAAVVGLVATATCLLAAAVMPGNAALGVGSTSLEADPYVRLFLVAAALALLVSQVAGLAHGWQRELPLATLGALGLVGIALTVGTPAAAMLTVAAAGTLVVIASLERAISMPAVRAAASGFRLAAIAGFMGLVAMAITGMDPIFVAPDVLAGATLLMAAAVAIRVGAIPLHAPVARLIERARTAALPLLAAWVPAAFAVIALGWTSAIVALGATTPIVVVVVAFGVLTIALASAVVIIDDDLVRWLGYGVIADGGFVLLALAGDTTSAISAGLAWLVCFAIARSIMACVVLGFQGAFDARRTRELEGWLRRMPLLGLAMLASLVVAFGVPGTLSWQVRMDLAQGALGEPLGTALVALALLPLVPVARLAWTGIRPLGAVVAAGGSERFAVPHRTEIAIETSATAVQPSMLAPSTDELLSPPTFEPARAPGALPIAPELAPGPAARVTLEPAAAGATGGTGAAPDVVWAPEAGADTLWGGAGTRSTAEVAAPGQGDVSPPSPTSGSVAPTLSSAGRTARAARAARKASQPTIAGPAGPSASPAGPDEPRAPSGPSLPAPPTGPRPKASAGPLPWAPALARLRTASASASASVAPLRHALRDLPAIWALDRTLIASIATLALALVGLAFAADVVGLGAAAGLASASTPAP